MAGVEVKGLKDDSASRCHPILVIPQRSEGICLVSFKDPVAQV